MYVHTHYCCLPLLWESWSWTECGVGIIKNLNHKLVTENAIIVKADKGKTTVIIYSDDYSKKVHNFLTENKFQTLQKKPTDKY